MNHKIGEKEQMKTKLKEIKCKAKKLSLITKFRKFWGKLSEDERADLWSIMTALRGPDRIESTCAQKYATTSRIRGELFGKEFITDEHGSCICGAYAFASQKHAEKFNAGIVGVETSEIRNQCGSHFLDHIVNAIRALKKHVEPERIKDLKELIKDW